jgi:hypothetical protein
VSLAIKYENVEDATMRLRHSVVLYKDTPVYITEIVRGDGDDILRVRFQELPVGVPEAKVDPFGRRARIALNGGDEGAADKRKYISSKHFDIAPFKLGYVNSPKGAFYCSRMPNRIQKQGLCGENFTAKTNNGIVISFQTFLSCEESVAMVKGEYPTFDQALKALAKCPAVAFDREFCLVKDEVFPELITYLYHKGTKVGMFNKEELSLGQKFKCLKEQLQEMKIKVGVA